MFRKRGLSAAIVFTLALGLAGAPAALAAGPSDPGPGGFFAAVEAWTHQLLVDWFGWGEPEQTLEVTYEASDCPEDDPLCGGLEPTGSDGVDSTTDEGPVTDPNG